MQLAKGQSYAVTVTPSAALAGLALGASERLLRLTLGNLGVELVELKRSGMSLQLRVRANRDTAIDVPDGLKIDVRPAVAP